MYNLGAIHHVVVDSRHYTFTTLQAMLIGAAVLLEIILRCLALWKSARAQQKGWFIVIVVINSFGIIPLLYLLFANKRPNGGR
ncbi:MAG TPA: DUF5652 family protein [Candidatus Saccharimonadales bacterium]|nr:DUF5652 family protein [Candidatus Saccharimonadales bacterium]